MSGSGAKEMPCILDPTRGYIVNFSTDTRYNLSAHIDEHNTGVLVVDLQGGEHGSRSRDAGGIMDEMGKDDRCVIM